MIRTLVQLQWMTLRGRVIRSVRLLKQPKYLVGAVVGVGWMLFWVGRPLMQAGFSLENFNVTNVANVKTELLPAIHLVVAVGFTVILALPWLYPFGKLGMKFREAELTLLLQAPLTRRQVIGYGLLKALFGVVLTAFAFALILGIGGPLERLRGFLALVLLFVFWDLNGKWRGLFLLHQREIRPGLALARRVALTVGLLAYLAVLLATFVPYQLAFFAEVGGVDFAEVSERIGAVLAEQIGAAPVPALLRWLVWPGYTLTAPLFAESWAALGLAALPVLVLIVVQRELVLRHPAHFEETALEHARDEETKKSPTRRLKKLSGRARTRATFELGSLGRPELAIVWKNLMRVQRVPLRQLLFGAIGAIAALAAIPIVFGWSEVPYWLLVIGGAMMVGFPPVVVGMAWHNDLRSEFGHIELLRTWPVGAERFVLAQVVSPAVLATMASFLGAVTLVAAPIGSGFLAQRTGVPSDMQLFPDGGLGVPSLLGLILLLAGLLPLCAGGAFASSAIQNLAVLFVPAWMAESGDGSKGIAAFGRRLVFGMGVFLAFALALLPSAVLVALALLLQGLLDVPWSAWAFPFWGLLAALPLFIGGWLVVRLAAGLWRDLDPSEEVLEIGA